MALQKKNNIDLVKLLIAKGACINYGIAGAAFGNHLRLANQLLAEDGNKLFMPFFLIKGAGARGDKDLMDKLVAEGQCKSLAAYLFASGGHKDLTIEYINLAANPVDALTGALYGCHLELANEIYKRYIENADYTTIAKTSKATNNTSDMLGQHLMENLIEGLAREGCIETYKLLSEKDMLNKSLITVAVKGASTSAHHELVQFTLDQGVSPDVGIRAAIKEGHIPLTKKLISMCEDSGFFATNNSYEQITLAAAHGHHDLTRILIELNKNRDDQLTQEANKKYLLNFWKPKKYNTHISSIDHAAVAAMSNLNFSLFNQCVDEGANITFLEEIFSNASALYENREDIEYFVTFIKNATLRELIIENAAKKNIHIQLPYIDKLRFMINERQLNFNQAQAYLTSDIYVWVIYGFNLVKTGCLSLEIFNHIASFLTPLTLEECDDLCKKIKFQHHLNLLIQQLEYTISFAGTVDFYQTEAKKQFSVENSIHFFTQAVSQREQCKFKAEKLLSICKTNTDQDSLASLLKATANSDDFYQNTIRSSFARFSLSK